MTYYDCYMPTFVAEEAVSVGVSLPIGDLQLTCIWWDGSWHLTLTLGGEKRSCVLYPNTKYFPLDPLYSILVYGDKEVIGYDDLSNLHFLVELK